MRRKTGKILGIYLDLSSKKTILEKVRKGLNKSSDVSYQMSANRAKPLVIVTPNPEQVVFSYKHPWFAKLLNEADVALLDGIGLGLYARYHLAKSAKCKGQNDFQRIPGVEFMEDLVGIASKERVRIGLIGGEGKVAVKAFECLQARYPELEGVAIETPEMIIQESSVKNKSVKEFPILKLAGGRKSLAARLPRLPRQARDPRNDIIHSVEDRSSFSMYDTDTFHSYIQRIAEHIVASKIQVVFVALGAPKQELFAALLARQLQISNYKFQIVIMSVGGAFDMIAGKTQRAPQIIRKIGFEWLYRLILEPWRWRRQLALLKFIYLCIRYH